MTVALLVGMSVYSQPMLGTRLTRTILIVESEGSHEADTSLEIALSRGRGMEVLSRGRGMERMLIKD